jgi:hypothetical protein
VRQLHLRWPAPNAYTFEILITDVLLPNQPIEFLV